MVRTRVGYTGGKLKDPTYHHLGDHTESVQLDFDPVRVSYAQLLDVFWRSHNPFGHAWSRQYMAAVFCHGQDQLNQALSSRERQAAGSGRRVTTEVLPASAFYLAEDYHQKYHLRQHAFAWHEFKRMYPRPRDLIDSTAAARVNGYLGGEGTSGQLQKEIGGFGLSPAAAEKLQAIVRRRS